MLEQSGNMSSEDKEKILSYLQNQIAQTDYQVDAYVFDEKGNKNPLRDAFVKINHYLEAFLSGAPEPRWIILSGVRGVGKTTLLSQLYSHSKLSNAQKIFLSVDQAIQYLGVSLNEILKTYEEILGSVFERLTKPIILFLDEVQYEKDWGIILKSLHDRSKKVFIVASGSSALSLQTNADVVRRAAFETLFPMSLTEYIKIKTGKLEIKPLGGEIRRSIFESSAAEEVFSSLKKLESRIIQYWTGIDRLEIEKYLKYGTLPFSIKLENEGLIYDQIKKILERVISVDIQQLEKFQPEIISKIPSVVYALAGSDIISIKSFSRTIGIHPSTLTEILEVLEKAEILTRVYPYGSSFSQVRKPSKYLFTSPAFRSMFFNFVGHINQWDAQKGKMLEDAIGLYLIKFLEHKINISLTYDSAQGGADFIIGFGDEKIIVEVGYGSKGFKQITSTAQKVKAKYGLSISSSPLSLSSDKTAVSIPLRAFLLI